MGREFSGLQEHNVERGDEAWVPGENGGDEPLWAVWWSVASICVWRRGARRPLRQLNPGTSAPLAHGKANCSQARINRLGFEREHGKH